MPGEVVHGSGAGPLGGMVVHVVRSFGPGEATARLQSQPLIDHLAEVSGAPVRLTAPDPDAMASVPPGACLVFHYNDFPAIAAIRSVQRTRPPGLAACLCSDIYSFSHYTNVQDIADVFVAPTDAHRRVLAYQLAKPVRVLPEAIDTVVPAGMLDAGAIAAARMPANKRVAWFGYAESFGKGMASVLPALDAALASGTIDGFSVITNRKAFGPAGPHAARFTMTDYATATFHDDLRASSYAMLSHMPLDLELNSLIKSPNKLVTALMCGLVPLCSDTPNYADLLRRFGLDAYVFSSPAHLASILAGLDPARDRDAIDRSGILAFMLDRFSQASVARCFAEIVAGTLAEPPRADLPTAAAYAVPRTSTLREHLADLLPSAGRLIRARADVMRQRSRRRR